MEEREGEAEERSVPPVSIALRASSANFFEKKLGKNFPRGAARKEKAFLLAKRCLQKDACKKALSVE